MAGPFSAVNECTIFEPLKVTEELMDGWMDGWMDGRPPLPPLPPRVLYTIACWKWNSPLFFVLCTTLFSFGAFNVSFCY